MGFNQKPDELTVLKKKMDWFDNQINLADNFIAWLLNLIMSWKEKRNRLENEYNKKRIEENV